MDRRKFLATGALGLAATTCSTSAKEQNYGNITRIHNYDVVIAGGGPSGCAATIAACRSGAKAALIEKHPCFGGVWTMGALAIILDSKNQKLIFNPVCCFVF